METTRAKIYNRQKLKVFFADQAIGLLFWVLLVFTPINSTAVGIFSGIGSFLQQFFLFALFLAIAKLIIHLPLSFYSGFIIDHRFSLSNQNYYQWCWESLKGLLVGAILGVPVLLIFYFTASHWPSWWWLLMWAFTFVFSVLLMAVAPLVIFPLFYQFEPLRDENLTNRLRRLTDRWGMHVEGIFRFNLSKSTRKANAAFTGLGKTRRILLADNLLDNFTPDEIEAVVAHELGHHVKNHLIKNIIIQGGFLLLGFFLIAIGYQFFLQWRSMSLLQLEALPCLGLLFFIYSTLSGPLINALSRWFEFQADHFAARESDSLVNSLRKLAELNLANPDPHPLIEFFLYSHPSIKHRLQKIQEP